MTPNLRKLRSGPSSSSLRACRSVVAKVRQDVATTRRGGGGKNPNDKGVGPTKQPPAPPLAKLLVVIRLRTKRRLLNLHQELNVALGLPDLVGQQLKALLRFESGEDAAQLPHDLDFLG
jgi:hypothetical protein